MTLTQIASHFRFFLTIPLFLYDFSTASVEDLCFRFNTKHSEPWGMFLSLYLRDWNTTLGCPCLPHIAYLLPSFPLHQSLTMFIEDTEEACVIVTRKGKESLSASPPAPPGAKCTSQQPRKAGILPTVTCVNNPCEGESNPTPNIKQHHWREIM